MATEGYYLIGSTVRIRVKVTDTETRAPANGTVTLVALSRGNTDIELDVTGFAPVTDGEYLLRVPTDSLAPGTYNYVVRFSTADDDVTIAQGVFVLRATAA